MQVMNTSNMERVIDIILSIKNNDIEVIIFLLFCAFYCMLFIVCFLFCAFYFVLFIVCFL
jgi:hypothetical protein